MPTPTPRCAPTWILVAALLAITAGCAGSGPREPEEPNYLRYIGMDRGFNEYVLQRWKRRQMPVRVYLVPPDPALFEDSPERAGEAFDAVKRGLLAWEDVVEAGVPSFTFVEERADADIPVQWAREPNGDWYIARCSFDIKAAWNFGVDNVLVTGRRGGDRLARPDQIFAVAMHEFGHALGLAGHSPDPGDIMYARLGQQRALSDADRATLRMLYASPVGRRASAKGR